MKLAEDIIEGYYRIRNYIKKLRDKFFKTQNKKNFMANAVKSNLEKQLQETEKEVKINQIKLKSRTSSIKKLLGRITKQQNKGLRGCASSQSFKNTKKVRSFLERNSVDQRRAKSTLYGTMPLKQYRHLVHPASKMIIGQSRETRNSR